MNRGFLPIIIASLLVLVGIPSCVCQNEYETCRQPFDCGNLTNLAYPFNGGSRPSVCGSPGFNLTCEGDGAPFINISSIIYRVVGKEDQTRTLTVSRNDLWSNICTPSLVNISLDNSPFNFYTTANDVDITLIYGCTTSQMPSPVTLPGQFNCSNANGATRGLGFFTTTSAPEANLPNSSLTCNGPRITSRIDQASAVRLGASPTQSLLESSLQSGFSIQWSADDQNCQSCVQSGGTCGSDQATASFSCHCTDGTLISTCPGNGSMKGISITRKYAIMQGVLLIPVGIVVGGIICYYLVVPYILAYMEKKSNPDVEKFLQADGSLAKKRYNYYEIKKMTKSFKDKLGQGGFGIVYKGELPDGQPVAVKVLTHTHDDGQEFMNEVASISRTSHVNIVNLLGFCYGRKKRALVYEYMPNKSLDKFICTRGSISPESSLGLDKLYVIVLGVARGLEYLHRGCNTRIVHFDIKPQNILLDEDFCPKISDFGLAKLFRKKQSMISMLGMRGTIGYIAPEVFSRNFGVVSHKSDVYSYGMMLLQMMKSRQIVDIESCQSSEHYFPDNIYDQLVMQKNEKGDDVVRDDEKEESEIKMLLVGLWCIQTAPSDRPSMSKVLEMLE